MCLYVYNCVYAIFYCIYKYIYIYIYIYLIVKFYEGTKIYIVSLFTATYLCKIKNVFTNFTNVELNILKSDINSFLSMCKNYLQETAIKLSTKL